jgi:hypothetical protein
VNCLLPLTHSPNNPRLQIALSYIFSESAMPPFSKASQLVYDIVLELSTVQSKTLPGQPLIHLNNHVRTKKFLHDDLLSEDIERMAPRL